MYKILFQRKGQIVERYRGIDGDSGVIGYENGSDFIRVQFSDSSVYLYTYASAGSNNIEEMKRLAVAGDGLNAFINKNVRKRYAKKER
jgi:hypothetical protein